MYKNEPQLHSAWKMLPNAMYYIVLYCIIILMHAQWIYLNLTSFDPIPLPLPKDTKESCSKGSFKLQTNSCLIQCHIVKPTSVSFSNSFVPTAFVCKPHVDFVGGLELAAFVFGSEQWAFIGMEMPWKKTAKFSNPFVPTAFVCNTYFIIFYIVVFY